MPAEREPRQKWLLCPVCGNKTRLMLREDTELKHFPLYCPKCHQSTLIDAVKFQIREVARLTVNMEKPDAKTRC